VAKYTSFFALIGVWGLGFRVQGLVHKLLCPDCVCAASWGWLCVHASMSAREYAREREFSREFLQEKVTDEGGKGEREGGDGGVEREQERT
jgi:hypothetical protein